MKKLVPILLFFSLVVPHIVSAAWWNPLSWTLFKKEDKTKVLEDKVRDLERKLEEVTTKSATSTPKGEVKKNTSQSAAQVQQNIKLTPAPIPLQTVSFSELLKKYEDFKIILTNEKGLVKRNSELETERNYYTQLDELLTRTGADLGYLYSIKYAEPKPSGIVEVYVSKFDKLNSDYWARNKNYADNRDADEAATTKRKVINYIKENRYSLYKSDIHVQTAKLLYLFDKTFGTKYAPDFEAKYSQVETVEFANRFLIDQE